MKRFSAACALLLLTRALALAQTPPPDAKPVDQQFVGPKDAIVLIIRHAEKPADGFDLAPAGYKRADAYVGYFKELKVDAKPLALDYLFAAADSAKSHRPRLTIEPLGKAIGLKIDTRFSDKAPGELAKELQARDHGRRILVSWRHGAMPDLLRALGADPAKLLPAPAWPDDVYDWMLQLRYDKDGHLVPAETKLIHEHLMPGDAT